MNDDKQPEGPDFAQGVPATEVTEGEMLGGRVGDEAVLLTRMDGVPYAIGGACTHYQAPLADGIVKDGTVRCPWHHARFCLKTGEAVGAPAFDPVACYEVEETDGTVTVKGKKDVAPPTLASPKSVEKVVIVGGGAGGFAASEMLRRKGYTGALTLLSADADKPYDRPNCSKDFLAGEAQPEWMPLRDDSFYRDNDIDLRLNTEVESLDLKDKSVRLKGGDSLVYDALILATGAEPQRPDIPGLSGPNVFTLRSLKDAEAIVAAAEKAKTVAVVGASFIGLEAAAALKQRGLDVHVVAPETIPFEKLLGAEVGRWAKALHEEKGVVLHLGRKVLGFQDGVLAMDEGRSLKADFVVVGAGVKPRTVLAEAAGLKVDNGVLVDDRLRAAEGVYAIGDIARYPDPISGRTIRVEHWVHAERQGQHVARMILGEDAPYADAPFFWSKHFTAAFHYDGHAEAFDPPKVDGSVAEGDAVVKYEKDGKLLAVLTIDRDLESLKAEAELEG